MYDRPTLVCRSEPMRVKIMEKTSEWMPKSYDAIDVMEYLGLKI